METGHKHLAEQRTVAEADRLRLEPYVRKLSEDITSHQGGRTLKTITGRLAVPNNNVAVIVGGAAAEAGLVGSALGAALGDIGQIKSELLVAPAAKVDYREIWNFPYILPVAADLDRWELALKWYVCDVGMILGQRSYDSVMEQLDAAENYLRFGGEKPAPPPKQPPISGQLGQIAASSTGLTI